MFEPKSHNPNANWLLIFVCELTVNFVCELTVNSLLHDLESSRSTEDESILHPHL